MEGGLLEEEDEPVVGDDATEPRREEAVVATERPRPVGPVAEAALEAFDSAAKAVSEAAKAAEASGDGEGRELAEAQLREAKAQLRAAHVRARQQGARRRERVSGGGCFGALTAALG